MQDEHLTEHVRSLIETKNMPELKPIVSGMEMSELYELFSGLDPEELAVVYRLLSTDTAAEVLGELDPEEQETLIRSMSSDRVSSILNAMRPDERTRLLEEMPGQFARRLLNSLRGQELRVARELLDYPKDSIGRFMTPEYAAVRPEWTINEALEHIRKVAPTRETVHVLFVADKQWKLLDCVELSDVVMAQPQQRIRDIMDRKFTALKVTDDREEAVELFKLHDAIAMPVVNAWGVLVGVVTNDDVMDLAEQEDTEDIHKMAGISVIKNEYFSTGFFSMLWKRLPWLILLLFGQMLTTLALTNFRYLALFPALVVFMPLINSPAGNTGSQAATIIVRGMALKEMSLPDWWRIMSRELLRGFVLGVSLAAVGFAAALVFGPMQTGITDEQIRWISISVAAAIGIAVTSANVLGSMLPLLLGRLGLDPALMSTPFIAWLMDVSAIFIYFTTATLIVAAVN
ncbi:MAG: magnesium transporter [Kiritimatiellia bacterium]